jgi:hypothetical protein
VAAQASNVMLICDDKWRAVFIDLDQARPIGTPLPKATEMALTPTCAAPEYIRHWKGITCETSATTCIAAADTFCFGVIYARLYGVAAFDDNESAIATLIPRAGTIPLAQLDRLPKSKQGTVRALCEPDPEARPSMSSVYTNLKNSHGMTVLAETAAKAHMANMNALSALRCVLVFGHCAC